MADIRETLIKLATAVRDERNAGANTANRVGSLLVAICEALSGLDIEELSSYFLRKDREDSSSHLVTFLAGLAVGSGGKGLIVDNNKVQAIVDTVVASALKNLLSIVSKDYSAGDLGTGFSLTQDVDTGDSKLVVDRLLVRKIAEFIEIQVKRLSYVGGQIILSAASMTCSKVEEVDGAFRCYLKLADGERTIRQEFRVGDQARCQTFNLVGGEGVLSNTYYWRLVTAVGEDYIDLSIEDCDEGSTAPAAGDFICLLGSREVSSRQSAIILSAMGDDAPSIKQYDGIDSYSLQNKECTILSKTRNKLVGDFYSSSSDVQTLGDKMDSVREEMQQAVSVNASNKVLIEQLGANVDALQQQADQEMTIWFYEGEPSMMNEPAKDWSQDQLAGHDQDIFYSTDKGRAWRFEVDGSSADWTEITDKQTLAALEKAAAAANTAQEAITLSEENATSISRNTTSIELLAKNVITENETTIETSSGIVTTPTFNGLFTEKRENGEVLARADIFTDITEDGESRSVIKSDLIDLTGKVTINDVVDSSGQTIIEGGKIKSSLLDVDTIMGEDGEFSGAIYTKLKRIENSDAWLYTSSSDFKMYIPRSDHFLIADNSDILIEIFLPSQEDAKYQMFNVENFKGAHLIIANTSTEMGENGEGATKITSSFMGMDSSMDILFYNGVVELFAVDGEDLIRNVGSGSTLATVKWCVISHQCEYYELV